MTTPEQKHQKSKTMKDLYQKPEMRFVEMPTTSPPYVLRAVVGDGSVGNARMEIVEGGEWRVVARYRDHAGDWDALEGCADYDDAREWAERWFQARWDETWRMLCGEPVQDINVQIKILPPFMRQSEKHTAIVYCGDPDNVVGEMSYMGGRYCCVYHYAGRRIVNVIEQKEEIGSWFDETHIRVLSELMEPNLVEIGVSVREQGDETWKVLCGDGWQSVGVDLPEMGVPVWLYQPGRGVWIGGRGEVNAEDGWLWGNSHRDCYSTAGEGGLLWHSDTLEIDDDYQPTHWMLLPQPPSGENA